MLFIFGLLLGSTYKIEVTKCRISFENTLGIGEYYPFTIFIAKNVKLLPSKGGFNEHSSYKITPSDQISDLKLYILPFMSSGER